MPDVESFLRQKAHAEGLNAVAKDEGKRPRGAVVVIEREDGTYDVDTFNIGEYRMAKIAGVLQMEAASTLIFNNKARYTQQPIEMAREPEPIPDWRYP